MINAPKKRKGILLALAGPSGCGKSTIIERLHQEEGMKTPISCTTRKSRNNEKDGKEYHFLSSEDFEERERKGDFLEYASVHQHLYGTLKEEILLPLQQGNDLVIDIDNQGVEQLRSSKISEIQEALIDIFIYPPNLDELEKRLTKRGTENEKAIKQRLKVAEEEMKHWQKYTYCFISSDFEQDYKMVHSILIATRNNTQFYIK